MTLWHALISYEEQDARNPDEPADGAYALVFDFKSEVTPRIKIEGAILLVNRAGYALIKQSKSALDRGNMDRQVRPVENQHLGVEDGSAGHRRPESCGRQRHNKLRNFPKEASQVSPQ